jgi:hypothetical protein
MLSYILWEYIQIQRKNVLVLESNKLMGAGAAYNTIYKAREDEGDHSSLRRIYLLGKCKYVDAKNRSCLLQV